MTKQPDPRADYYAEGATWEYEVYLKQSLSRRRAWIVAGVASAIAVLAMLSVVLVLPLKEFAPYVVTKDKSTGYIEVTRGLKPGDLQDDEAVTMANIVQCLTARETFDAQDVKENFAAVNLCMAERALAEYLALYEQGSPSSPVQLYGYEGVVSVQIKSVQLLSPTTASVRFQTTLNMRERETVNHWVAAIQFRYVQKPASLADRFKNPLGFQITRYRRDQEILTQ